MYNIAIYFYKLGIFIASFLNEKAKKLRKGQSEALDFLAAKADPKGGYVWFHAASLGEFEQGRPVIEQLKKEQPDTKILLTFFSPSGYEIRKNYSGADLISYLPLDTPGAAKKFVKITRPQKAIFIKYEFWPNYIRALNAANIPIYSISAIFRPNQIFFKWYGGWYRKLLQTIQHIFVQDQASFELLSVKGFQKVTIAGDTRFDRVTDLASQSNNIPLVEAFVKDASKVIVAGSSWPKDEELLVRFLNEHPDTRLILVPHEIHEAHINSISKLLDGKFVRYTQATPENIQNFNCLVVDTIGMLSSIYRYADVAYIGGGFGVGIHNTLEAAVWNVPVVFGPNYEKFREACQLIEVGGGFSIESYDELNTKFDLLLEYKTPGTLAGDYVKDNTGATKMIMQKIV